MKKKLHILSFGLRNLLNGIVVIISLAGTAHAEINLTSAKNQIFAKHNNPLDALEENPDLKVVYNGSVLQYNNIPVKLLEMELEKVPSKEVDITITGTVVDHNGEPIPGATVSIPGTEIGTATDIDGKYTLSIPEGSTLVFSFIGFESQSIAVGDRSVIDVTLSEDMASLDEVVVVGYSTQKKVNLTGSVASVDSEFLEGRPLTNSTQALQGVSGLYVNQAGGQPGADNATIRIRGIGTLNDNNPLVLVDGIEYRLEDVNPNDIESISVLKDAASASIYGSRAANGVVLITTKSGKNGKVKVELNSYYGIQQATYVPDMVTNSIDFMLARNQASINEGQPAPYSEEELEEYKNGTDPDLYPNTDWWDIMFSNAPIQDNHLRISGGSEKVTYSMSMGYMNQDGIMMGTEAKKYSFNSNFVYNLSENLRLGANINNSYWDRNEPYSAIGGGGDNSMMGGIARALPIHPNILSDGRYGDTWLVTPGHNIFRHPVVKAREGMNNHKTLRSMVKLFAEYSLPFGLEYKANLGINKYDGNNHRFVPEVFIYNPKEPDVPRPDGKTEQHVWRQNNSNLNTNFYHTLDWTQILGGDHEVKLLLGQSMETFYNSDFNAYVEGFLDNELTELNAGTNNQAVGGTSNQSRLLSFFGRANYGFSDKYLFEASFRYDGSSRFAKENRWGLFPSVSAGWRINEEPFMESFDALNELKLRASWGQLGNQNIGLYSFLSNININQGATFNNNLVPGTAITTLSDPDISWETTTITNIGLDIALWYSLDLSLDVFDKATTDILARINVPGQVGNLTGPITNLYEMSNKGIEMSASYANSIGDFNYRIGGDVAYVQNKVEFLNEEVQYNGNRILKEGHPVDSWFLYDAMGIFQTQEEVDNHAFQHENTAPGDIIYRDVNHDGVIDLQDKDIRGRTTPKFTFAFNLNFDYKGLDFSAFFQGVEDISIYPTSNIAWPLFNGAGITKDQIANYWTPENPDAKYPRLFLPKRGYGGNAQPSTFWLRDASYVRLKNVQLGYTIPTDITGRINISKIRVYVNSQNPLTWSDYNLTDPEKDIMIDNIYTYPTTKIFSLGCNVTF